MPLRNEFSRASIWEAQRFLRPLPFLPALGCVPQRRLRSACVWGPPLRRTELASLRRRCDRRDLRSYARDSGRCNLRELKDRIAEAAKAVSAPLTSATPPAFATAFGAAAGATVAAKRIESTRPRTAFPRRLEWVLCISDLTRFHCCRHSILLHNFFTLEEGCQYGKVISPITRSDGTYNQCLHSRADDTD
jgi:hypothetical protein